jgi:hypothetical protein
MTAMLSKRPPTISGCKRRILEASLYIEFPKISNLHRVLFIDHFWSRAELVRILFQEYNVPFRTAHKIVGSLAGKIVEKKINPKNVTAEMLRKVAEEVSGISLTVTEDDVKASVDVANFVNMHNVRGGPAPMEVMRMINSRRKMLAETSRQVAEMETNMRNAVQKLI